MNAQHLYKTPVRYNERLMGMFGATMGVLVGFFVLSLVLVRYKLFIVQEVIRPIFSVLSFFVPTLAVIGIVSSLWVFAHVVSSATRYPKLLDKLDIYETASILRWTLLCVPMAFSLIGFSLTGRRLFQYLFGILLLFLGAAYPSRKKASAYLRLSYDHHDIILNDEFPLQNADQFEDEPEETPDASAVVAQPIPH
ncbi:MAG: hypothetical protein JNN12_16600 [Bacteroidetes Order II. Incertae sedis bacterium]|nr:hypothetical protein [Bacteroidetes Order II. bacterium]